MPSVPENDCRLYPALERYGADVLAMPPDPAQSQAATALVQWLAEQRRANASANVVVICTGNSRRSVFGAVLGNIAAAYAGHPDVRFYSGGTEPSAVNPRALRALEAIGVIVEPTGREAPAGITGEPNPVYRIRWGEPSADRPCEMLEFSKHFADPANPRNGFAALLVCDQAAEACPIVTGAAVRIAMPFADPKAFDGTAQEESQYAQRRDEIARTLLYALTG